MKIQVKQLKPNPFRNVDRYPISKEKVEALKNSIKETSFWDNIIARKADGGYEIAYGHHRLIALKELGIKAVDIPVKDLSDALMIKIMANENLAEFSSTPVVINETVHAARDYLNDIIAKCKTLEDLQKYPDVDIRVLFGGVKGDFKKVKDQGVGRETILRFLGKGWKEWLIQEALDNVRETSSVDREAIEVFPTMVQAQAFKKAVRFEKKVSGHTITKEQQRHLSRSLAEDRTGPMEMFKRVHDMVLSDIKKKPAPYKEPVKPELDSVVKEILGIVKGLQSKINSVTTKAHTDATSILELVDPDLKENFIKEGNSLVSLLSEICSTSNSKSEGSI